MCASICECVDIFADVLSENSKPAYIVASLLYTKYTTNVTAVVSDGHFTVLYCKITVNNQTVLGILLMFLCIVSLKSFLRKFQRSR